MTIRNRGELIERIEQLVAEEVAWNPVSYNKVKPCQCYERIGYEGRRWSVEKRIAEYGLDKLCGPNRRVLDIGSNFGFCTVEFALRCKLAHGVEPNPTLIKIGTITAEYLGAAERVEFFDTTFEEFESDTLYDLVLSFSSFTTTDGRQRGGADDYFAKVNRLLADGGHLFFESGSFVRDPAMIDPGATERERAIIVEKYQASKDALEAISSHLIIGDQWETPSGSPGYFRQFAVAKKRGL